MHRDEQMSPFHTLLLKMQVSFRKRADNYMALLQKETYKKIASDASSPPCTTGMDKYVHFVFESPRVCFPITKVLNFGWEQNIGDSHIRQSTKCF